MHIVSKMTHLLHVCIHAPSDDGQAIEQSPTSVPPDRSSLSLPSQDREVEHCGMGWYNNPLVNSILKHILWCSSASSKDPTLHKDFRLLGSNQRQTRRLSIAGHHFIEHGDIAAKLSHTGTRVLKMARRKAVESDMPPRR